MMDGERAGESSMNSQNQSWEELESISWKNKSLIDIERTAGNMQIRKPGQVPAQGTEESPRLPVASAPPSSSEGHEVARMTPELRAGLTRHWDELPLKVDDDDGGKQKERTWGPQCDREGSEAKAHSQQRGLRKIRGRNFDLGLKLPVLHAFKILITEKQTSE